MRKKILIIKLSSFGDILHALPLLNNLKAQLPGVSVDWLVYSQFKDLLVEHSSLNKLWELPRSPLQWPKIISELKNEKYDFVIELQGLLKTSLLAKLIKPKQVLGLVPARESLSEMFLTNKINCPPVLDPNLHIIQRNLKILEYFDWKPLENVSEFNVRTNARRKDLPQNFIICAPQSNWASKNWPKEYWHELFVKLSNYQIVLLATEKSFLGDNLASNVVDLSGQTSIQDLMSIVPYAKILIGSDSGLIHLAAAYGIKTLGLYGATSPTRTGPWRGDYLFDNLDCSPCHKRACEFEGDLSVKCLKNIKPEAVVTKLEDLLHADN
jgi:lipopolysaccharide heptosyltransferase I